MSAFFRKLMWLVSRRRRESELIEELRFHLNEDTAEKEKDGLTSDDARRAALLEFGNLARVQEDVRASWSWIVFDHLRQDLSYAVRGLWRSPQPA